MCVNACFFSSSLFSCIHGLRTAYFQANEDTFDAFAVVFLSFEALYSFFLLFIFFSFLFFFPPRICFHLFLPYFSIFLCVFCSQRGVIPFSSYSCFFLLFLFSLLSYPFIFSSSFVFFFDGSKTPTCARGIVLHSGLARRTLRSLGGERDNLTTDPSRPLPLTLSHESNIPHTLSPPPLPLPQRY